MVSTVQYEVAPIPQLSLHLLPSHMHTHTYTHTRDKSDNIELLRYRVQSLQECCERQEKRLEQLEAENQRLMREGGDNASLGDGER